MVLGLVVRFLVSQSGSLLVIDLFRLSIPSKLSLARLNVSTNVCISFRYCVLLAYNYLWHCLMILSISVTSAVTFHLSLLIIFSFSFFFQISLPKGLSILFYIKGKTTPSFGTLFFCFPISLISIPVLFSSFCYNPGLVYSSFLVA